MHKRSRKAWALSSLCVGILVPRLRIGNCPTLIIYSYPIAGQSRINNFQKIMIMKNLMLTALSLLLFVAAAMAQNVPAYVPTNGLVGWWPFNGNANDESGNGNNGTVNGAALTSDRFGNVGKAYSFDGTSNYIAVNLLNAINTTNVNGLTLSGWTNMTSLTNQPQSIIFMVDSLDNGFNTGYDYTSTKLYGQAGDVGVPASFFISSLNTVVTNNWYNVVMTCDFNTNTSKLFINGVLQSQSSVTLITPLLTKFFIGSAYNQVWYQNGKLDDIGIWNRALTQQEITDLYTGNTTNVETVADKNQFYIHPNPTRDHITINYGNFALMSGYQLRITNSLGQQMFQSNINQQSDYLDLSSWTGNGIYFVNIIDPSGNTVDIKKIVLQ